MKTFKCYSQNVPNPDLAGGACVRQHIQIFCTCYTSLKKSKSHSECHNHVTQSPQSQPSESAARKGQRLLTAQDGQVSPSGSGGLGQKPAR